MTNSQEWTAEELTHFLEIALIEFPEATAGKDYDWNDFAGRNFGDSRSGTECHDVFFARIRKRIATTNRNERRRQDPEYDEQQKAQSRATTKTHYKKKREAIQETEKTLDELLAAGKNRSTHTNRHTDDDSDDGADFSDDDEDDEDVGSSNNAKNCFTKGGTDFSDLSAAFVAQAELQKTISNNQRYGATELVKSHNKNYRIQYKGGHRQHKLLETLVHLKIAGTPKKRRSGQKPPASEPPKKTRNRTTFASRQTSRASFASPPSKKKSRILIPPRTEPKATRNEHRTSFSLRSCDSDSDESFDRGFSPRRSFYNQATSGRSPGVDDVSSPTPIVAGDAASAPASAKRKLSPPKAVDVETVHSRNLSFSQPAPKSTGAKRMRRNDWTGSPAPAEQKKPLFGGGWPGTMTQGPNYGFPVKSVPASANAGGLFGGNTTARGGFGVGNTINTGGFFGAGVQGSAPAAGFDVGTPGGVFGGNTAAGFFGAGVQGSAPAAGFDVGTPGGVFGGNTAAGFNPFSTSAP